MWNLSSVVALNGTVFVIGISSEDPACCHNVITELDGVKCPFKL